MIAARHLLVLLLLFNQIKSNALGFSSVGVASGQVIRFFPCEICLVRQPLLGTVAQWPSQEGLLKIDWQDSVVQECGAAWLGVSWDAVRSVVVQRFTVSCQLEASGPPQGPLHRLLLDFFFYKPLNLFISLK